MIKKVTFFILCLQGFVIAFNVGSISAVVPAIARDFGISAFTAGRINWAYMLPYGVGALLYGPLTRLFHNRQINVATLSLFALFSFLSGCATGYKALFVFRFLVGLFAAATTPLVLIYLADRVDAAQRGRFVGLFFSTTFAADLAGLFLSGILPWRWMFFIPAGLAAGAAVLTALFFPRTETQRHAAQSRYIEALRSSAIWRAFAYIFLISLFYHGVRQWLGVYFAQGLGWVQMRVSWALTFCSLAGIVGEAFGGVCADKKGRVATLKFGGLLLAAAAGALLAFRQPGAVLFLMLVWGLGWAVNHAGMSTLLTDMDKRFMKEVSSLNSSVRFVAGGLGVVVGGALFRQSFRLGFFVYMLLLGLLFLATDAILRTKKKDYRSAV
ncbi:MAG: MFS transporter [Deltaproteobacteria bacterium]